MAALSDGRPAQGLGAGATNHMDSLTREEQTVLEDFYNELSDAGETWSSSVTREEALKVLMARSFDRSRAKELFFSHRRLRMELSLFNMRPSESPLYDELSAGKFTFLEGRSDDGCAIGLFESRRFTPLRTETERQLFFQNILFNLDSSLRSLQTQRNGIMIIIDLQSTTFSQMNRKLANEVVLMLTERYPAKLKKVLVVNLPKWLDILSPILWKLVKEKIRDRVVIVSDVLHHLKPDILPLSLKGTRSSYHHEWLRMCISLYNAAYSTESLQLLPSEPDEKSSGIRKSRKASHPPPPPPPPSLPQHWPLLESADISKNGSEEVEKESFCEEDEPVLPKEVISECETYTYGQQEDDVRVVGSSGGVLQTSDTKVTIPPGALMDEQQICLESSTMHIPVSGVSVDFSPGHLISLTSDRTAEQINCSNSTKLSQPVTIRIPKLPGVADADVRILRSSSDELTLEDINDDENYTIHQDEDSIEVSTRELGHYACLAVKETFAEKLKRKVKEVAELLASYLFACELAVLVHYKTDNFGCPGALVLTSCKVNNQNQVHKEAYGCGLVQAQWSSRSKGCYLKVKRSQRFVVRVDSYDNGLQLCGKNKTLGSYAQVAFLASESITGGGQERSTSVRCSPCSQSFKLGIEVRRLPLTETDFPLAEHTLLLLCKRARQQARRRPLSLQEQLIWQRQHNTRQRLLSERNSGPGPTGDASDENEDYWVKVVRRMLTRLVRKLNPAEIGPLLVESRLLDPTQWLEIRTALGDGDVTRAQKILDQLMGTGNEGYRMFKSILMHLSESSPEAYNYSELLQEMDFLERTPTENLERPRAATFPSHGLSNQSLTADEWASAAVSTQQTSPSHSLLMAERRTINQLKHPPGICLCKTCFQPDSKRKQLFKDLATKFYSRHKIIRRFLRCTQRVSNQRRSPCHEVVTGKRQVDEMISELNQWWSQPAPRSTDLFDALLDAGCPVNDVMAFRGRLHIPADFIGGMLQGRKRSVN